MSISIDKVIDEISQMPLEDQEMVAQIITKRLIEEKREIIYQDYINALHYYKNKKTKNGTVDDLFNNI